jgi:hypothetical protein
MEEEGLLRREKGWLILRDIRMWGVGSEEAASR